MEWYLFEAFKLSGTLNRRAPFMQPSRFLSSRRLLLFRSSLLVKLQMMVLGEYKASDGPINQALEVELKIAFHLVTELTLPCQ